METEETEEEADKENRVGPGRATDMDPDRINQAQGLKPCLVKVYEPTAADAPPSGLQGVRLNEVVEVVGVLGVDPRLALFQSGQAQEVGSEQNRAPRSPLSLPSLPSLPSPPRLRSEARNPS